MPGLVQLAATFSDPADARTRLAAGSVYPLYERYFEALRTEPVALLELGVHRGELLKTVGRLLPARDRCRHRCSRSGADFAAHPNVRFELADQRDGERLSEICRRHAPGGFDIIIDDASHLGTFTLMSYLALFPHLKPGGLYCVEDWATGYWSDWPDGAAFSPFEMQPSSGAIEKRIPHA